jgi:hypothetical protein
MTDISANQKVHGATRGGSRDWSTLDAADWLGLSAAPIFAIMALLSGIFNDPSTIICAAMKDLFPLSGMVPMYVLMSVIHLSPWLKLKSNRRRAMQRVSERVPSAGTLEGSRAKLTLRRSIMESEIEHGFSPRSAS